MIVNSVKWILNKIQVKVKCSHENWAVDKFKFLRTFLLYLNFSHLFSLLEFFLLCIIFLLIFVKVISVDHMKGIFNFLRNGWQPTIVAFVSLEKAIEYSLNLKWLLDTPPSDLICFFHFFAHFATLKLTIHEIEKSHQLRAACFEVLDCWCVGSVYDFFL